MSESVTRQTLGLLHDSEELSADAKALVDAALRDVEALNECIDQVPGAPAPSLPGTPGGGGTGDEQVYLSRVSLAGFRGVASRLDVELNPAPGLVIVTGRNGSGKSSIAEAAEVAISGGSVRAASEWWADGIRNVHHDQVPEVEVALRIDGGDDIVITSLVKDDRIPAERTAVVASTGDGFDLVARGWAEAIEKYPPILTYTELSMLVTAKPSTLFDAIHNIVGLDSLGAADKLLTLAITEHGRQPKDADTQRKSLLTALKASADPRAAELAPTLKTGALDLDAARAILSGGAGSSAARRAVLKEWADLQPPPFEQAQAAVDALAAGVERDRLASASSAGRAAQLADLLDRVIAHREHDDDRCPVCGQGVLDATWLEDTQAKIAAARHESTEAREARSALQSLRSAARALLLPVPAVLAQKPLDGVDPADARGAWTQMAALGKATASGATADHILVEKLPDAIRDVGVAALALSTAADQALATQDTDWAPLADAAGSAVTALDAAVSGLVKVAALTAARDWVRKLTERLRVQRVQQFRSQATAIWSALRQDSNVTFDDVSLEGTNTRRRVDLTLTVDGTVGSRSVLSQGELAALGLALFLPRSSSPESPFRFIVVDDPVQSMDPSKIDGLARVLHALGEQRQVVVFTHDDRLIGALRRLGLPATAYVVERQAQSNVAVRLVTDAVEQYMRDADALAKETTLPADLIDLSVAGYCRDAIEEVAAELAHTRLLGEGRSVADADAAVLKADVRTRDLLALALLGDARKNGAPLDRRLDELSTTARDVVKACVEAVHEPDPAKTSTMVVRTRELLTALRDAAP